jgi:hypothetical protein
VKSGKGRDRPLATASALQPRLLFTCRMHTRRAAPPQLVSSLSRPAGLATTSVCAATGHTQHGVVSADDDAGLPAAVPAPLRGAAAAVQIRSEASVRRCVSLPALSLNATANDNDGDVLMRPRATAAALLLHPLLTRDFD